MLDDLFAMLEPPAGAVSRLRTTLRRREQRRRRRRAALGATIVLAAVLATLRMFRDPVPPPAATVAAFDVSLHPALALVDDAVLPPAALRGPASASVMLFRRPTLDDDVLLYELAP